MWIIPIIIGVLLLTGASLAQSPGDEQHDATSEELNPSSSEWAALTQAPDDEGQGRDQQAPGVHVWKGRLPSKGELQTAVTGARSKAKSLTSAGPDAPDFQNDRVKIWIGRLPKPETLRNMLKPGGGGR